MTGAFTGFNHIVQMVSTTHDYQSYVLEAASGNKEGKWNPHSEGPIVGVQLTGQPAVMSSWPPQWVPLKY